MDTLMNERITLLNPAGWADRNDRDVMALYATTTPGKSVFAYCMAEGQETAHHWQVFADRGFGACIVFNKAKLVEAISVDAAIHHDAIAYVNWHDPSLTGSPARLPFVKRQVYRAEREYRIIATPPAAHKHPSYSVAIPLEAISSVSVSGEVPEPLFETFRRMVHDLPNCRRMVVRHSGLLQNPRWTAALESAMAPSQPD